MGLRFVTMLTTALGCAVLGTPITAAQSPSSLPTSRTLIAISTAQAPPAPQPPRVPGEPPTRTPPTQSPPPSQPATPKATQITITGCIEQNQAQASSKEPAPTGTSGKTSGAPKRSKFILTNPKIAGALGAPNSSSSSSSSYQLDARDSKLSSQVGHQVEVTGTLKSGTSSGDDGPTLKVDSIKTLSTTCSASSTSPATPDHR